MIYISKCGAHNFRKKYIQPDRLSLFTFYPIFGVCHLLKAFPYSQIKNIRFLTISLRLNMPKILFSIKS